MWDKVREKRIETGIKQPSKVDKDRSHLLTGLLRCPACGSPMYTNKHAWTNKDGIYKDVYYYVCSRNRMVRGKSCTYKAMLKKTEIEPLVIEAIKELVSNETFAKEVKSRIGTQLDTTTIDREIKNYETKLREVDLNKTRLENEIDTLPEDTRYRDRNGENSGKGSHKGINIGADVSDKIQRNDRFSELENNASKGYPFEAMDELEEYRFINQGSHRSKSVHIYDEGLEKARALLEKYGIEDWEG